MDIFDGLSALGGLCLFLFGMSIMAEALQRRAGGRLGGQLRRMTRSRWAGFFTGLAVTAAVQSSSAAMVMVVGFVNSGLLTLGQAVGVIIGTNVGTTVTPWLLSLGGLEGGGFPGRLLRPAGFVPLLSLWGIIAYLSRNGRRRDTGQALLGFATLMQGMELMSGSVAGLAQAEGFRRLFTAFTDPLLGLLAGAMLTAVIQSSSASVGILQALAASGQVTVGAAVPIIMGQNIGTCITALISSIGTNKNAKRTAVIHLTFNIIGVVCGMALFYGANAIFHFAFLDKAVNGADIAAIHTAFNVFCTVLLFPFGKQLEKLSCLIVRDKADKTQPAAADNDALVEERFLMSPSFAIEKCRERTNDMARLAQKNTLLSLGFIRVYNKKDSEAIHQNEKALDAFEDELETYLVKISSMQLSLENSMQVSKLSHAIGNFERIGDYAVNILKTKRTMHEDKIHFSKEASKELEVMSSAVQEIITKATNAFIENDVAAAQTIEPLEQVIDNLKAELRARHTKRLQAGECTIETGMLFFDIINSFERIADHCSNLAVCIIELSQGSYQTHRYLKSVKSQENARFMKSFEDYLRKYALH